MKNFKLSVLIMLAVFFTGANIAFSLTEFALNQNLAADTFSNKAN